MSTTLIITVLIVVFALAFDFINGFHDTANAIATSVSTKALRPSHAILLAATMNLLGALSFTGVAKTISDKIVESGQLQSLVQQGTVVILAALISAILWNLLTWYYGIPSSSSHTLIGSIAGAAIAGGGFSIVKIDGLVEIIKALIFSPVLAFVIGYIIYSIFKLFLKNLNLAKTNKRFRYIQILTAALQSYTHGTNDAQKSMGIITLALITAGKQQAGTDIHFWVQLACAVAMGLGTSIGGWKIIKTVGSGIMKIRPVNGVAADLTSAGIIFGATLIKLPVSTTHVIASSILGVGSAHRVRGVKWNTAINMVITWVITFPISAIIAAIIYKLLMIFF